MSIRIPLLSPQFTDVDTGSASVAGGVPHTFNLPQDCDNIVVKFTASTVGGAASTILQTTDDGGTTWWDVARTSIVSNANSTVTAEWLNVSVANGAGQTSKVTTSLVATGSLMSVGQGTIGQAGASTLGARQVSGLPIMSQLMRVFTVYTGNLTSSSVVTTVKVNSQTPSGQ